MRLTRLYIPELDFTPAMTVALSDDQSHYLLRVLRLEQDNVVVLFNEKSGGWTGSLQVTGKKATVLMTEQIQQPTHTNDVWLLVSPLKKEAWYFVIEKITELGAHVLQPILMDYTQNARVNVERDRVNLMEASQQCERTDIPHYKEPEKLTALLRGWDAARVLFVALERSDAQPALHAFQKHAGKQAAILVGPEGGFSPAERKLFDQYDFVVPISLGDLVLRAETAVVSALAIYSAAQ